MGSAGWGFLRGPVADFKAGADSNGAFAPADPRWLPGFPTTRPQGAPNNHRVFVGDPDDDGEAELLSWAAATHKTDCWELGPGTWHPQSFLGQQFVGLSPLGRNGKLDAFEPNDSVSWSGGVEKNLATRTLLSDRAEHDHYPAIISHPGDVDWYEGKTQRWSTRLWVPPGKDYMMELACEPREKAATGSTSPLALARSSATPYRQEWFGSWYLLDIGRGSDVRRAHPECADRESFFVKVWSPSGDSWTRPYLLNLGR